MARYQRIRDLREDADMYQKQIAKLLHCSQQTYSDYECGKVDIPTEALIALADFMTRRPIISSGVPTGGTTPLSARSSAKTPLKGAFIAGIRLGLSKRYFDKPADGGISPPGGAPRIFNLSRGGFTFAEAAKFRGFAPFHQFTLKNSLSFKG